MNRLICHCNLTSRLSGLFVTSCIAIITSCYLITLHQKRESTHSPPPSEKKNITSETISSTQFPWEPRSITKSQSKLSSSDSSNIIGEETTTSSHQKQLQFLASMTFTNTSLREPSCACCI